MPLSGWDRVDAVALDLAESVRRRALTDDIADVYPSAGITQFRFMRSARVAPSQPVPRELPLRRDVTPLSVRPFGARR